MKTKTGGKNRRKGKSLVNNFKREILYREDNQLYGLVEKMLGDKRVLCKCSDKIERICHIRGKFHRRVWINTGDMVLISLREFEPDKGDIIHKYTNEEGKFLIQQNEFELDSSDSFTPIDDDMTITQENEDSSEDESVNIDVL